MKESFENNLNKANKKERPMRAGILETLRQERKNTPEIKNCPHLSVEEIAVKENVGVEKLEDHYHKEDV